MAKTPAKRGVSRRQYALSRNISEAAVRKQIGNGTLAKAVLIDGSIDANTADRLLAASVTRGPKVPIQVTTAKARRLRAQIRLLQDKVDDWRKSFIVEKDIWPIVEKGDLVIAERVRRIPGDAAAAAAGLAQDKAHLVLSDCVNRALVDLHQVYWQNVNRSPRTEPARLNLDGLTPSALSAMQINLHAQLLEYQRALNVGHGRLIQDVLEVVTEKTAIGKALLVAIPSRVAVFMEGSSQEEARARISEEIEKCIAVLDWSSERRDGKRSGE
ncbi:MAG: hypothetical protein ABI216_12600 [Devosia sp.]